jgi:3-hydroxybutyrate dehydrogenase
MQATGAAALVGRAREALGAVDILVNNAGIQHTATIAEFPVAKWDAVIGLNLSAPFHCMQAAIPGMVAAGWGRIINIASAHGLVGSAQKSAYVAAKHGLMGLTKVGAIELANTGVTVNAICPGWVLTPLVQAQIDARAAAGGLSPDAVAQAMLGEKQAMHQFTTPEGLGGLAVFLCSDAARTMTGAGLSMDGGWVAQ